ncbi:MAG: DMT family transporter [Acidobacteriota bacterium]|nr:DMT family transporter [Acidobacteriota bacterium]
MPSSSQTLRGYLYISAAALFWGISATMGRAAFTGRLLASGKSLGAIDPLILSQSRTTLSFLVFLAVLAVTRGWREFRIPASDCLRLLLLGVLGVAASNYFYYLAIQRTNVATAIVVQYTAPIWVLLYMVVRGLQKPTLGRVGAVILALSGITLVIGIFSAGGLRLNPVGVAAALIAALSFAFYNVAGHTVLARYDRWIVLFYTTFFAALFWMVINPPWKIVAAHYSGAQWSFLAVFSMLSMLVPFSLYFAGLQHLEPTRAIVVSCLEPVFSTLIAALVLGELLRGTQLLGMVMVLAAIVVAQLSAGNGEEKGTICEPVD